MASAAPRRSLRSLPQYPCSVTVVSAQPSADREPAARATWQHIPALDGLRAFAVIAVLLFHGGYLEGGFLGVDLFFALSGFLITSLLIRDAEGAGAGGRPGIDLAAFWGRRFRRLLPAVLVMISAVAVWSWLFGSGADLEGVKRDGPWAVVYLANWHFISESSGYWASFAQPSMFDHLWSLAIEEQFYVLWPLVVLVIWAVARRPQRALLVLAVTGAVASLAVMFAIYDGGDPTRVYMGTDTRASSVLVGALVATAPARRLVSRLVSALGRRLDLVVVVLGGFVLWSWASIDGASAESLYRGGLFAHSLACAVLVVTVASASEGASLRMLGWAPLAWVGTLSYGLYLWHWPVYVVLTPERTDLDGLVLLTVRIAVSVAIAYASFRLVEDPLRHRVSWVRGRRGVIVLVGSLVAVLTLLWVLPRPEAEIAAFDPTQVVAPGDTTSVPVSEAPATTLPPTDTTAPGATAPPATAPVTAPATVPVEVPASTVPAAGTITSALWAGDSVAFDIWPALDAAMGAAGVRVDGGAAFPGLRLAGGDDAVRFVSIVPDRMESTEADTVLMQISSWDADVSGDDYAAALRELAATVGEARLIVVTSPPVGDDELQAELDRLAATAAAVADDDDRISFLDAAAVWVEPPVLDADGDGAPERKRDLVHVCPAGAANFAAWLVAELAATYDGIDPADPVVWAGGEWVTDPRYDDPAGACAPV